MTLTLISADHWTTAYVDYNDAPTAQAWGLIKAGEGSITEFVDPTFGSVLRLNANGSGGVSDSVLLSKSVATEVDSASRFYFQTKVFVSLDDLANRDVSNNEVNQGLIKISGSSNNTSDTIAFSYDTGLISVTQGVGTATEFDSALASTSGSVSANTWHHLEISILPGLSGSGRISMKLDGILEFDEIACSVDVNSLQIGHSASIRYFSFYDMWKDTIIAVSDSSTVEWLGPQKVYPITLTELSQNAGVFEDGSVANAEELLLNSTAVYLDSGDELLFKASSSSGYAINPKVVQVTSRGASGGTLHSVQKVLTNRVDSSSQPAASYNIYTPRALSPDGTDWTREDLYALEIGVEV